MGRKFLNRRPLILLLFLLFTLSVLAACNTAVRDESVFDATAAIADCPQASSGTEQLIDAAQGICFLYPAEYDASQGSEDAFGLYVQSPLNTQAPSASINFEAANGRSLDDLTRQRLADYAFPDTQPQSIMLDGEPAVMLDNLPGQDSNRRVFTIHNDTVIDLMVARIGNDYGVVGEQAEALYEMMTSSLQFIPQTAGIPRQAGPECPDPVANSTIFTNEIAGYCLLLPADYKILEISAEAADNEMVFYVDSLQDVNHPRLSVKVTDAGSSSLEAITAAHETEIETAVPGYDVQWSFGFMLDGEPANQFDQVPGQDLSKEVLMLHNGRLYMFTFTPDDPAAGVAYEEMQTLYAMVMDSFSLFWQ
ncbi:MAG: hypothetical protein KDE48_02655 [Anaerolineales bacterium]|nr:hypothetical protein [Anaerolineales bacterium]